MNRLKEIFTRKEEIKTELQNEEITMERMDELEAELRSLNEEEKAIEERSAKAKQMFNMLGGTKEIKKDEGEKRMKDTDLFNSVEYRNAFMDYVTKGTKLPTEYRSGTNTLTTDVGAIIPTETLNKIVEKIESYGMILPLVTRTNFKTGLTIPTSSAKPVATWVNEGAGSTKQSKSTGTLVFTHHKLRCAVSVSLEVENMAWSAFEATLLSNITEAMAKAVESAIINGDDSTMPKGILTETGAKVIGDITYKNICAAEGKLPVEYEDNAVWVMSKNTFMNDVVGMVDAQEQPVARVNYGLGGKPERFLLGRTVVLTNYLPEEGPSAFLFDFADYVLNTNFNIALKIYEDNETDDIVRKSILVCDGKVVDASSLVVISKA